MSAAAVVYLGEKHDNAGHQQRQLWVLGELLRLGHRPVLGLEMFSVNDSGALMEYTSTDISANGSDHAGARLRAATGMQSAGNETWSRYGPLLQLARTHKLSVFGIDLPVALRAGVAYAPGYQFLHDVLSIALYVRSLELPEGGSVKALVSLPAISNST